MSEIFSNLANLYNVLPVSSASAERSISRLQWRTQGGRGGELPWAALPKGRDFGKNVKMYVKMVKIIYVKKGYIFCKYGQNS